MAKRVLVVEDNLRWRQALCDLYETIMRRAGHAAEIVPASNGEDAIRLLRSAEHAKRPFDLLSLDINLGRLANTDNFDDGRDVLSKAHSLRACRAVIVITGVLKDEEIDLMIADSSERINIRANLPSVLARLFPNDRSHYVPKINPNEPDEEVQSHVDGDFKDRVLKLSRSPNRFCYDGFGRVKGWRVSYGDSEVFVQDDKPGGMRAIALMLGRPNPERDFQYSELFVPEVEERLRVSGKADAQVLGLVESRIDISDSRKDRECIERLLELDRVGKELLESFDHAKKDPLSSSYDREALRERMEGILEEKKFILKDGYRYDDEKKKYVSFQNTFGRVDKNATDLFKKRIRRAIQRIANLHEECGKHLSECISVTGNQIAYLPREPVDWDVTLTL